jgi:hypothetical protein
MGVINHELFVKVSLHLNFLTNSPILKKFGIDLVTFKANSTA